MEETDLKKKKNNTQEQIKPYRIKSNYMGIKLELQVKERD